MLLGGTILGNRYEIINLVGSGGMADVYKAKCHRLNRFVAIKVLKEEFAKDAEFIKRFHTEAQSAAGLVHPNIVNIYDVGEGDGLHYIVMELLEGITLKEFIHQKGTLSEGEVVTIAGQIGQGLEAAHKNKTVHRDIKPQNIIITEDGRIKVADFGIARASSGNTIAASALGSVHYFSPEQARGGYVDCRSDIYSLGITMYEMITGHVPFDGENTIAIAIKHIQEEIEFTEEEKARMPQGLGDVILKAVNKKPELRYETVSAMLHDLNRIACGARPGVVINKETPVAGASTVIVSKADVTKIKELSGDKKEKVKMVTPEEEIEDQDNTVLFKNTKDLDPKLEKIIKILAIIVGGIFVVVFVLYVLNTLSRFQGSLGFENKTEATTETKQETTTEEEKVTTTEAEATTEAVKTVIMPNLVEKSWEEALELVEENDLIYEVKEEVSDNVEAGFVIRQSIKRGEEIEIGTKVTIVVSLGKDVKEVPNVTGKLRAKAEEKLVNAGFAVIVEEAYSADVEQGRVISQTPEAEEEAEEGSKVTIVVSKGQEEVSVPSVTGRTQSEAINILESAKLTIGTVEKANSDIYEAGIVISQTPEYGSTVLIDTKVNIVISSGPANVRYTGSVTMEDNPFAEEVTSGTITLVLSQEGSSKTIYNAVMTPEEFPLTVSFEGFAEGSATVDIYVDNEYKNSLSVTVAKAE